MRFMRHYHFSYECRPGSDVPAYSLTFYQRHISLVVKLVSFYLICKDNFRMVDLRNMTRSSDFLFELTKIT